MRIQHFSATGRHFSTGDVQQVSFNNLFKNIKNERKIRYNALFSQLMLRIENFDGDAYTMQSVLLGSTLAGDKFPVLLRDLTKLSDLIDEELTNSSFLDSEAYDKPNIQKFIVEMFSDSVDTDSDLCTIRYFRKDLFSVATAAGISVDDDFLMTKAPLLVKLILLHMPRSITSEE